MINFMSDVQLKEISTILDVVHHVCRVTQMLREKIIHNFIRFEYLYLFCHNIEVLLRGVKNL